VSCPAPPAAARADPRRNLTPWAEEQGVLLLNAALTVRAGEAASHSNRGWETFTHAVLAAVDTYGGANLAKDGTTGVVFLAWGAHAAKRVATLSKVCTPARVSSAAAPR
jgi:uracil-DNA glycosylase